MDNRGSITLLGLWISAAAAAIALMALSTEAALRAETAAHTLSVAHARFAAADAALLAHAGGFSQPAFERNVDGYVVRAQRLFADDNRTALICDITGGTYHGVFRLWCRAGADWTPVSWSEQ